MTGDRFEEFTKELGRTPTRRGVLKGIGVAVAGGVAATVLKPFRGEAVTSCPDGKGVCGTACCDAGAPCASAQRSCCCGTGQTACGTACCVAGVSCADKANSICGCPAGRAPCGTGFNLKCCAAGTACSSTNATCLPVANFNTTAKTCPCHNVGEPCRRAADCCSGQAVGGSPICRTGYCSSY